LIEGRRRSGSQPIPDQGRTLRRRVCLGVDLHVVHAMLMHQRKLKLGPTDRAIAALEFAAAQLGQ
jgi:hypothetical protein